VVVKRKVCAQRVQVTKHCSHCGKQHARQAVHGVVQNKLRPMRPSSQARNSSIALRFTKGSPVLTSKNASNSTKRSGTTSVGLKKLPSVSNKKLLN
jgi:hypothetical protein